MQPQEFTLQSEILDEFRYKLDFALNSICRHMVDKKLPTGTVAAKIKIEMEEQKDKETGEIYYEIEVDPAVDMKIGAKGRFDCDKKKALARQSREGTTWIADNQISMDDLLGKKGA